MIATHFRGRTDNNVKNMFHSTLRRQLRIVNNLISLKTFKSSIGFDTSTMITADIYPLIRDGSLTYDDIMKIGKITISDMKSSIIAELRDISKLDILNNS